MPSSGSAQLRVIAAQCQALGDRGLMNRTRAALRVEAQPIIRAAKASAEARLPKAGGLNKQVAAQRWTVSALAGVRTSGVFLKTKAPDTDQTDKGFVRHPLPRNRRGKGQWRRQELPPQAKGWASDTVRKYGPAVAAGMMRELNIVAREVAAAVEGA